MSHNQYEPQETPPPEPSVEPTEASAMARATDPALRQPAAPSQQATSGALKWTPAADLLREQGQRLGAWYAGAHERVVTRVKASAGQVITAPVRAVNNAAANHHNPALPPVGQTPPAHQAQAVGA